MKLRFYQQDIVNAQNEFLKAADQRAKIFSPTGSGKTICFIDLIKTIFDQAQAEGRIAKILVAHPRIALSLDQQKRFAKEFPTVQFTSFHSGAVKQTKSGRGNVSTTQRETLEEILNSAKTNQLVFSSYASLFKIADIDYDAVICDEAHYLVQDDLRKSLDLFAARKVFFYTATPVNFETDQAGMEDELMFGTAIAHVLPSELIPHGYIVAPRLRMMEIDADAEGDDVIVDPALVIARTFVDQRSQISEKIKHKMLVAMPSTLQFDEIMNNLPEIRRETETEVDVYTITASTQLMNGQPFDSREEALSHFEKNKGEAIIIHCDTLAEGIDIDGMTGAFVFRTLSKAKFIQTIGRCARPLLKDLDENFEVKNMAKRIKPNCMITIPTINGKFYSNIDAKFICEAFSAGGYGDLTTFIDVEANEVKFPDLDDEDDILSDSTKVQFAGIIDYRFKEEVLSLEAFLLED